MRGDFRSLPNKNVQMLDHFFPLLFPKHSESLKILDIRLREVGDKKTVKRYLKSEQTDTRTDERTNRLIESISPEGRCFENMLLNMQVNLVYKKCMHSSKKTLLRRVKKNKNHFTKLSILLKQDPGDLGLKAIRLSS